MTDDDALLHSLGLTQVGAAAMLGVSDRAIRMWASGDRAVPEPVAKILRLVAAGQISAAAVSAA